MKLSTRARYALRMMLQVARHTGSETVSLGEVSKKTKISRRYLDQLATALKHARLLRGRTGRGGGYELMRTPTEVRIGEIIEAVIGPINIVECVREPGVCQLSDVCEVRWVYTLINQRITEVLDEISLADLMKKEPCEKLAETLNLGARACPSRQTAGPQP